MKKKKEIEDTKTLNVSIFPCKGMAWFLVSQRFGKLAHFRRWTFKGYKGSLFAVLLVALTVACLAVY